MTAAERRLRETSVEFEVPFRHVDMLGVVWHGHYYSYMEQARTALLRACELDRGLGSRYAFFVIESRCRHSHPLHYGDRVRVTAWLRDIVHRINVAYELYNVTREQRAARGHTILATVDHERKLLLETPNAIQRLLLA